MNAPPRRFYLAHVRGPFYDKLRDLGFVVLYPALDDYVFLEDKPENEKLLRKQSELGIYFLRKRNKYQTVSEHEVARMLDTAVGPIEPETAITVVTGHCANLDGKVIEVDGQKVHCRLQGYNRTYDVWLDRLSVVNHKDAPEPVEEPADV
jgi:hypothetical protein